MIVIKEACLRVEEKDIIVLEDGRRNNNKYSIIAAQHSEPLHSVK